MCQETGADKQVLQRFKEFGIETERFFEEVFYKSTDFTVIMFLAFLSAIGTKIAGQFVITVLASNHFCMKLFYRQKIMKIK